MAPDAYASSEGHLADELRRMDTLVRAHTIRWRATLGASKPPALWGMVHISDAEVDAFLHAEFRPPGDLPTELETELEDVWGEAEELRRGIDERLAATHGNVSLRLPRLERLFSLSGFERDVLVLCFMSDLDPRYRRLFGYLQDDASLVCPSIELILDVLHPVLPASGAARSIFHPAAPLFRQRLLMNLSIGEPGPWGRRAIQVEERVAGYLLGDPLPEGRLVGVIAAARPGSVLDDLVVEPEQRARLAALAEWLSDSRASARGAVLYLHGPYGSGRLEMARAVCSAARIPLLVVDVGRAMSAPVGLEAVVELCYREATLRGAALYWQGCDALLLPDQPATPWLRLLQVAESWHGPTFLAAETPWDPIGRFRDTPFLRIDTRVPAYGTRRLLWGRHLPRDDAFAQPMPDRALLADLLANSFQLTGGQIQDAVAAAWALAMERDPGRPQPTVDDVYEGCRRQTGRRLVTLARRIEPRTALTFDDLILPRSSERQLRELRNRVRLRGTVYTELGFEGRLTLGRGLIAMFTGASGTGKTMAAELLAREQGVDLYKVDLAGVASKWVGETEKNLSRIFAEAEDANAIVFFDEADALFGKRGEVKEARDRWANMEVDYLLQRIEEYSGVVILASNLGQNLDEAFMRRIQVIVDFPFPDAGARLRIWQGMFPTGVGRPSDDELEGLAKRFRLSGGSIKNIVVDAAFRSLAENHGKPPQITVRHVAASIGREYQKTGRPITKGEFGEEIHGWVYEDVL